MESSIRGNIDCGGDALTSAGVEWKTVRFSRREKILKFLYDRLILGLVYKFLTDILESWIKSLNWCISKRNLVCWVRVQRKLEIQLILKWDEGLRKFIGADQSVIYVIIVEYIAEQIKLSKMLLIWICRQTGCFIMISLRKKIKLHKAA